MGNQEASVLLSTQEGSCEALSCFYKNGGAVIHNTGEDLLKELVDILKPFREATDWMQGEKIVTICCSLCPVPEVGVA